MATPPVFTDALEISIPIDGGTIAGNLTERAQAIVVFAHGSGSGRNSPRNREVARGLNDAGLSTLLVDLLSETEAAEDEWSGRYRFDIPRLAERLIAACDWLESRKEPFDPIGIFGASTGAAAALIAAARRPETVRAVVSRGGRPDLAQRDLPMVQAPTLLIVGGDDDEVIRLNQSAHQALLCDKELAIVPGATHLFEEPGKLDEVAHLATDWFRRHLHLTG